MFGIHHKLSPRVSSDFSLLPPLLSLFLPPFLPCFTEDCQKGERCCVLCLPVLNILPCFLSFYFLLPLHFLLPVSFHLFGLLTSIFLFVPPFKLLVLSLGVCLPVSLVPCLTLPFLPAVLSGVFQTFGAGQESPGLARLSPHFVPIRSDTRTRSSSQQQLQED